MKYSLKYINMMKYLGVVDLVTLKLVCLKQFCCFELHDSVPDHTSLNRFRNKLIQRKLKEKLFTEINRQLESLDLKVQKAEAAIIDATVIEPYAKPRKTLEISEDRQEEAITNSEASNYKVSRSCDKDAKWLKKGKNTVNYH